MCTHTHTYTRKLTPMCTGTWGQQLQRLIKFTFAYEIVSTRNADPSTSTPCYSGHAPSCGK